MFEVQKFVYGGPDKHIKSHHTHLLCFVYNIIESRHIFHFLFYHYIRHRKMFETKVFLMKFFTITVLSFFSKKHRYISITVTKVFPSDKYSVKKREPNILQEEFFTLNSLHAFAMECPSKNVTQDFGSFNSHSVYWSWHWHIYKTNR